MADKPVSIVQLKAFIEAVEFAADTDNWIPSERQWRRIREMIDRLEEAAPRAAAPAPQPMPLQLPMPIQQPVMPQQMAPGGLGSMMHPGPVPTQQLHGPFATGNPQQPVRPPDIDTSNGQYVSSFA